MAFDQLADELTDVFFDAWPVEASPLPGVRDREDPPADRTYVARGRSRRRVGDEVVRARAGGRP